MIDVLSVLSEEMTFLELNYEFGRMSKSPPDYPYWIGDYTESEPLTEDGEENATIILTGFSRGKHIELEKQKELIKKHFKYGRSLITGSGTSIAIFFAGSLNIPVEDNDLKRCQINLSVKNWKGR